MAPAFTCVIRTDAGMQKLQLTPTPDLHSCSCNSLCYDRNLGKSGLRVSCLGLGKSQSERCADLWLTLNHTAIYLEIDRYLYFIEVFLCVTV